MAVWGRPDTVVQMPEQKTLAFPESLSMTSDFKLADRKRPHPEQVLAAKGPDYTKVLVQELVSGMNFDKSTVLVVANISPYIEDAGKAVISLKVDPPPGWPIESDNLHYISFHTNNIQHAWAEQMVKDTLEDLWISGRITTPGYSLTKRSEQADEEKLKRLGPKGKAAMGDLSGMEFEVLVRDGSAMRIADSHVQTWMAAPEVFKARFEADIKEHQMKFENMLTGLTFLSTSSSEALAPPTAPRPEALPIEDVQALEYDSIEVLKEKEEVLAECQSKVTNVSVITTKDGKVFLLSPKQRTIEPRTIVGGCGRIDRL